MIAPQAVLYVLCGALHITAVVEGEIPPTPEDTAVEALPAERGAIGHSDILRMQVICTSDGLAQSLADLNHPVLNHERFLKMDYIGPFCGLFHKREVALGKMIAVAGYKEIHEGEFIVLKEIIRLGTVLVMIGAGKDSYILTGFLKILYSAPCRCRKAVSGSVVVIYDK